MIRNKKELKDYVESDIDFILENWENDRKEELEYDYSKPKISKKEIRRYWILYVKENLFDSEKRDKIYGLFT